MISTGATIETAAKALIAAGSEPEIIVVATHGLLVGPAVARLAALPLKRIVVSDSLIVPPSASLPLQVVSLAPILAESITRLHVGESMSGLLSHQ